MSTDIPHSNNSHSNCNWTIFLSMTEIVDFLKALWIAASQGIRSRSASRLNTKRTNRHILLPPRLPVSDSFVVPRSPRNIKKYFCSLLKLQFINLQFMPATAKHIATLKLAIINSLAILNWQLCAIVKM